MAAPAPPSYDAATNDQKYPPGEQAPPYPTYAPQPNQGYGYPPPPPQQQGYVYTPSVEPPAYQNQGASVDNVEEGGKHDEEMFGIVSFDNKSIRIGFIRKVFAILGLQMAVTIGMTCWFLFHEPTKEYVQNTVGLYVTAYVLFLVLYIVLACCTSVARKHPVNLILLGLFTLSLGYMVAVISSQFDTKIVLIAFGITLFCSIAIIAFASQTKIDITVYSGALFILCIVLFMFGLFSAVLVPSGHMRFVNIVYASLGALLFMAEKGTSQDVGVKDQFLAFDTQLIMGGKKYELSPEDYVFAAMMLYVDVIYIFLFILSLLGGSSN